MALDILQTQLLMRHITMEPREIPECGPFLSVSVDRSWFSSDGERMTITKPGIKAFWAGVKKHGHRVIRELPSPTMPPNDTPPGGTPVLMRATA